MLNKINIIMYLETLFNKQFNEISKEELQNVSTITFEYSDTIDEENQNDLIQILQILPNLKKITIKNKIISMDLFDELSKLKIEVLSLDQCSLNNDITLSQFSYLQELNLTRCFLLDFSILDSINSKISKIYISNPFDEKMIDIIHFINYSELKELYLEKCTVKNVEKISDLQNLKVVSFLFSDILDIEHITTLLSIKKLQEVYLSEYYSNLEEVKIIASQKKVYYNLNHLVFNDEQILL